MFKDADEQKTEEKEKIFRLSDMLVTDVDLVDRAANKRRFLVVKRTEETMSGDAVVFEERDGQVVAVPVEGETYVAKGEADAESSTETEKASLQCPKCEHEMSGKAGMQCPKCGAEMAEKACKPGHNTEEEDADKKKSEKSEDYEEDKGKKKEEEEMGKADEEDDAEKKEEDTEKASGIPKGVKEVLMRAASESTERLMSVVSVLRGATVTEEETKAPLPNRIHAELKSVGALIKAILEKYPSPAAKAEGKGEIKEIVLEEHIRDFLSKTDNLSLPKPVRDSVMEKVRGVIEKLLIIAKAVSSMDETEEEMDAPIPNDLASSLKAISEDLEGLTSEYPSPASKSAVMLSELDGHFEGIKSIVSTALNTGLTAPTKADDKKKSEDEEDAEKKKKADEAEANGDKSDSEKALSKRVDELTAEIERLKGGKGGTSAKSNVVDDEGGTEKVKKSASFSWPSDLAEAAIGEAKE